MKEQEQSLLGVQEIKELIAALGKSNMGKLKLKQGDFELELESCKLQAATAAPLPAPLTAAAQEEHGEKAVSGHMVKSPIVGTFYAAPAPEQDPYVQVGSKVKKGEVLFIIESMKLMNEVVSEYAGTVVELLVENGQAVEYGQPILRIE